MKYRDHRGGFKESMDTVIEVDTKQALLTHLNAGIQHYTDVKLIRSIYDDRNGWNTYNVFGKNGISWNIVGMSDGDLK